MQKTLKVIVKKSVRTIGKLTNSFGSKRECYVCHKRFRYFTKFGRGSRGTPELWQKLDLVGSDVDNFGCMYCDSHDRERHLFMFFDKLEVWEKIKGGSVLHFAPELNLSKRISATQPAQYVRADLLSGEAGVEKIDATSIPYADHTFDLLIANHILEHIPKYSVALSEFHRVLKPGGVGILQTPYSRLLKNNFEDENINTDPLRLFFHGQTDHVRTFGEYGLKKGIEDSGLNLRIIKHDEYFDAESSYLYGVNRQEDLFYVHKPLPAEKRAD